MKQLLAKHHQPNLVCDSSSNFALIRISCAIMQRCAGAKNVSWSLMMNLTTSWQQHCTSEDASSASFKLDTSLNEQHSSTLALGLGQGDGDPRNSPCIHQRFQTHTRHDKQTRAVLDFGSGRNPALFPNPAEIRLRQKSHWSRIVLPDLKSQFFQTLDNLEL